MLRKCLCILMIVVVMCAYSGLIFKTARADKNSVTVIAMEGKEITEPLQKANSTTQNTDGKQSTVDVGHLDNLKNSFYLMRFDNPKIQAIKGTITKATLYMNVESIEPQNGYDEKYAYLDAQMLTHDMNWGKSFSKIPVVTLSKARIMGKGPVSWDVTLAVREWHNNAQPNSGLRINVSTPGVKKSFTIDRLFEGFTPFKGMVRFSSADSALPEKRPYLVIEYDNKISSDLVSISEKVRPRPPYHLWYISPQITARYPDIFDGMTINTTPNQIYQARWLNKQGIAAMRWRYGPNAPGEKDLAYFLNSYSSPAKDPQYNWAGIAVDEWVGKSEENRKWAAEGLRKMCKSDPNTFVVVWTTGAFPELVQLLKDDIVDVAVIEGYPFVPNNNNNRMQADFNKTMQRASDFSKAGVMDKVIIGWGWIVGEPDNDGRMMTKELLRQYALEAKKRFPEMPGMGFFAGSYTTPHSLDMYRYANELSKELYPLEKAYNVP